MRIIFTAMTLLAGIAHASPVVLETIDVGRVWSGHPVGFCLLTRGDKQYVAHYDDQRRVTVAARDIGASRWDVKVLPQTLGWDSHNYLTFTFDDRGQMHLAGNMHAVPLVYFRTKTPGDIQTLQRVETMVGRDEQKCTYPQFLRGPRNDLIFTYRSGSSGNGNQIYDIYDTKTQTWKRLLDEPLTDGQGKMNAYFGGPVRGPDGCFHLCWVWRDTGGCETNHDLSYARSRDLVHWENAQSAPLKLPMKLGDPDIVDPVPSGGGIINGNTKIGFDSKKRIIVSYHKFDPNGKTQVYNARLENGSWNIYQTTDWDYRWDFHGGGSIQFEIHIGGVNASNGTLTQTFEHVKYGSGMWKLDEVTLKPIKTVKPPAARPAELEKVPSSTPGMEVRWAADTGTSGEAGISYCLRWETLGVNRDRPRDGPAPESAMLRVYKIGITRGTTTQSSH